jgi:cytochrome c oxidase subunit II
VIAITGTRDSFDTIWTPYLTIALAVMALVVGAIVFAVLRYRVRADGSRRRGPSRPSWLGRLEIGWAVAVAIVVVVLLTLTFRGQERISALASDEPAETVDVTAFQWGWRFDYGSGVSVVGNANRIPTMVVPTGELVRFNLTSRDVVHSFWIPEERFKRDAFPDRTTQFGLVFSADPSLGRCAEYCGLEHDRMDFHVLPVSPEAFTAWLDRERAKVGPRA